MELLRFEMAVGELLQVLNRNVWNVLSEKFRVGWEKHRIELIRFLGEFSYLRRPFNEV